jgi:hypothetical protein
MGLGYMIEEDKEEESAKVSELENPVEQVERK